jgi:hypothetical protein
MNTKIFIFRLFLILIMYAGCIVPANAQYHVDTLRGKNLYHPQSSVVQDTMSAIDSAQIPSQAYLDSLADVKYQHMLDSIAAREQFVRDSIAHHQHVLDSLNLIIGQLPRLLEASLKTFSDNIILSATPVRIIGDSTLSNYISRILPLTIDQPYTPWLNTINLSDNPVKLTMDSKNSIIMAIQAGTLSTTFQYTSKPGIIVIAGGGMVASTASGKVFKSPIDSVFFDTKGRVSKVKRYIIFSQVVNNYKQGALLFKHLSQVKQYNYATDNQLSGIQFVNFCDRKTVNDPVKVCFMINYALTKQGNNYTMTRRTDPVNEYADGTFTYEFDNQQILKSIAFVSFKGTENWKAFIELNEAGYVNNYIYENKGKVNKSLLINYYLNDPKAKNKIETISCTFEDDGVSYYQINNTTGKSRVRDRLTMEWSPWR